MRQTSSIHNSESRVIFVSVLYPKFLCFNSLAISSIRVAYSITDSTSPCLMLSLMLIFLVSPYLVWILAVKFELSFFIILRFFPLTPLLFKAYSIASSHALSYAFCTSRKIMYALCLFSHISWILCLRIIRWSTVEHPGLPPACALVIVTCFFTDNSLVYFPNVAG